LLANVTIFGFAVLALFAPANPASLALAAAFGFAALLSDINPARASYSVAPTHDGWPAAGYLTQDFSIPRACIGLFWPAVGCDRLSVNFRLPNCCCRRAISAPRRCVPAGAQRETFLQGMAFGVAFLIGMAPTLIANAINAGSRFNDV